MVSFFECNVSTLYIAASQYLLLTHVDTVNINSLSLKPNVCSSIQMNTKKYIPRLRRARPEEATVWTRGVIKIDVKI